MEKTSYVANRSLGVRRPPNAFSLFLRSLAGKMQKPKPVRIRTKMSVFRMDLLRIKFDALDPRRRQEFEDAAANALQIARQARSLALATDGGQGSAPAVAGPAAHGESKAFSAVAPATAGGRGVDRSGDGPYNSTPPPSPSPSDALHEESVPAGRTVSWIDVPSSVQRDFLVEGSDSLGSGVFGTCKRVVDSITGEVFCVKFANLDSLAESARSALRADFTAMSRMLHPSVMSAYGLSYDHTGHVYAMIMPLMDCNLWHWLHGRSTHEAPAVAAEAPNNFAPAVAGGLHASKALGATGAGRCNSLVGDVSAIQRSCFLQLACGLAHIHGRQIAHLDIKPDNVLVSAVGASTMFKISDFGNAQSRVDIDGVPASDLVRASAINACLYRPFELFDLYDGNVQVRPRFDLWAFGCVVFDVARHPRWRSASGRVPRMMEGVQLCGGPAAQRSMWLARDTRVASYTSHGVRRLMDLLQPRSHLRKDQARPAALDDAIRKLSIKPQ